MRLKQQKCFDKIRLRAFVTAVTVTIVTLNKKRCNANRQHEYQYVRTWLFDEHNADI